MDSHRTRRDFVRALLTGAAGLTITRPSAAHARARGQAPAPLTATRLSDRITVLSGAGGNIGLLTAPDGLLLVDGGTANRAADVAGAVRDVSPNLVQVLFNTHYHFDHVGSNERLGRNRVRIIAHENVRTRLSLRFENAAMGRTFEPLAADGLPTETFTAGGRLSFGGETIEYTHTPTAHTDGDAFVFFASSNVIHTGDLFWVGRYPVVDYSVGGSLLRMAGALEQMEKVGDARTRIICGHGPADVGKAEMRQIRDMWLTINRRLEDFARQGRSVDEVLAAAPTKDFDAALGGPNPQNFLRQAYGGVLAAR